METFTDFMEDTILQLEDEGRYSTAYIYTYALKAFAEMIGGEAITFEQITKASLKRFQEQLRTDQKSWNTVSTYIRAIRAVYNRAVDQDLIKGEYRLFAGVFTGVKSTRKLALSAHQMQRLVNTVFPQEYPQEIQWSQDMFTLMLMLQGMPFVDLIHLKKEDLKRDHYQRESITCHRQKTGTDLNIKLLPQASILINKYRNKDTNSPFLLNVLKTSESGEKAFNEYRKILGRLDYQLSKLPKYCGLDERIKVSSYSPRHTWATLGKFCEVPEEILSEGLGHSSLDQTRTYLKSFEGNELEKANELIIDYIYTGIKKVWSNT